MVTIYHQRMLSVFFGYVPPRLYLYLRSTYFHLIYEVMILIRSSTSTIRITGRTIFVPLSMASPAPI